MANGFTFGGKSTWDFSIMKVEKYPSTKGAARRYQTYVIPGRNGALHVDEGAFSNVPQSYECYYHGEKPTNEEAHAVREWLLGTPGYRRLTDVYDTTHYRLAMVTGELDIENKLNRYGRFTVNFDCDPRAFLLSGENPVTFTGSGTITNPTAYDAQPLILVTGTAAGTVSVNGTTVEIKSLSGTLYLDCENENAYALSAGTPINKNSTIYAPSFPVLSPGSNGVKFTGGITSLQIIPRWWEL